MATTALAGLSASVTRILALTGFPKELKTKDIQSAFSEWDNANGGFKIKWRDDTSLLIVFQDATVAKKAYLHTVAFPPPILTTNDGASAQIKPYDGADAQAVIQNVNSRGQHTSNASRHNARSASLSTFPNGYQARERPPSITNTSSMSSNQSINNLTNNFRNNGPLHLQMSNSTSAPDHLNGLTSPTSAGREPSPTLPTIPSHPTLNALINSSLGEKMSDFPVDPAIVSTSLDGHLAGGPRIGDPGKRMLGAALGMRHPSLGQRMMNGNSGADQGLQRAMNGLTVAE